MRAFNLALVTVLLLGLATAGSLSCLITHEAWAQTDEPQQPSDPQPAAFPGLDSSVNEALAEEAGLPARDPLINTEAMGELWNLLLLAAGAVCGFIVGRYWDQIWGRRPTTRER